MTDMELVGKAAEPAISKIVVEKDSSSGDDQQNTVELSAKEDASNTNNIIEDKPATTLPEIEDNRQEATIDPEAWAFCVAQVARQLEYYFSAKNLSKDTYVQTLRGLNDGCVPISILANFVKVRQIMVSVLGFAGDEQIRMQAVWEAAFLSSTQLRVAYIDAKTGKEIPPKDGGDESDDSYGISTIVAIGTIDNQPIQVPAPLMPMTCPQFANAIVLRDVAPQVTAEDIQGLFRYEGCPAVINISPDVSNCWFVYLDTSDRAAVMDVLLRIRGEMLGGFPVHGRIKTSAAASAVPIDPAPFTYDSSWQGDSQQQQQSNSKNQNSSGQGRRKHKKRSNKNNKKRNNNSDKSGNSNSTNSHKNTDKDATSEKQNSNKGMSNKKKAADNTSSTTPSSAPSKKTSTTPPPSFCEEDFPTLVNNRVEWETTPVQDAKKASNADGSVGSKDDKMEAEEEADSGTKSVRTGSDSASTATTASSSTEPSTKKLGYAAALKNKTGSSTNLAGDATVTSATQVEPSVQPASPTTAGETKSVEGPTAAAAPTKASSALVKSQSWGSARSFAEILKVSQRVS